MLLADLHPVYVIFGIEAQLISDVVLGLVKKSTWYPFALASWDHCSFILLLKPVFAIFYLSCVSLDLPLFKKIDHPLGFHMFQTQRGHAKGLMLTHYLLCK